MDFECLEYDSFQLSFICTLFLTTFPLFSETKCLNTPISNLLLIFSVKLCLIKNDKKEELP